MKHFGKCSWNLSTKTLRNQRGNALHKRSDFLLGNHLLAEWSLELNLRITEKESSFPLPTWCLTVLHAGGPDLAASPPRPADTGGGEGGSIFKKPPR